MWTLTRRTTVATIMSSEVGLGTTTADAVALIVAQEVSPAVMMPRSRDACT